MQAGSVALTANKYVVAQELVKRLALWALAGEKNKIMAVYDYVVLGRRPSAVAAEYGIRASALRKNWVKKLEDTVPLPPTRRGEVIGAVLVKLAPYLLAVKPLISGGRCACGAYVRDSDRSRAAHILAKHGDELLRLTHEALTFLTNTPRVVMVVYVRYTKQASLFEVSEDYMKLAENVVLAFDDFLELMTWVYGPAGVAVEGETRSGGFSTRAAVVGAACGDPPRASVNVAELVRLIAKKKQVGYLRLDGVVKHLSEPYTRLFVKLAVPRAGAVFTIEWFRRRTAKAAVPEDVAARIVKVMRTAEGVKEWRRWREWPEPAYHIPIIIKGSERREKDAIESCRDMARKNTCSCRATLYSWGGWPTFCNTAVIAAGDELPLTKIGGVCECVTKRADDYTDWLYVSMPWDTCDLLHKALELI